MRARIGAIVALMLFGSFGICAEPIVRSLSVSRADARAFIYQGDADAAPEWGVVDGDRLILGDLSWTDVRAIALPPGTGLFDLCDTDQDGNAEFVALTDDGLCRWIDATAVADDEPVWCVTDDRFRPLAAAAPTPYPLVLAEPYRVRVPSESAAIEFSLDSGTLLEGVTAAVISGLPPATPAWNVVHDRVLPNAKIGIEVDVGYRVVSAASEETPAVSTSDRGTRRAVDAKGLNPAVWPSFPLTPDGTTQVHFALEPAASPFTLVRFHRLAGVDALSSREFTAARRYPGAIVAPVGNPPDFNGDGFADLLTWTAATPGRTIGSWIRAAQRRTWEVTLTTHLYDPATARYRARSDDYLKLNAPLQRVLAGGVTGPLGEYRLEDVNGDRRSDLVVLEDDGKLSIYAYGIGWDTRPFEIAFEEPVREMLLTTAWDGGWIALFRSESAYHIAALTED